MIIPLKQYIDDKQLLQPNDKVLVAVSGGLDSMVLLSMLRQLSVRMGVAHCNFQLRGDESDKDEAFVKAYCEEIQVPFFSKRFETNNYATENRLSIQMAARELRYSWFEEVMRTHGFSKLATAHHFNDSLETTLLNFTRGAGLDSLKGILPARGNIIRPLLFATRDEIIQYAASNLILWREDISNQTDDYQRNFIRRQIVPQLKRLNVSLENTLRETQVRFDDEWSFYQHSIANWKNQYTLKSDHEIKICKEGFSHPAHGASLLWQCVKDFGFNYQHCTEIMSALHGQPGKQFLTGTHKLVVDRDWLFLTPVEEGWKETLIELHHTRVFLGMWKLDIKTDQQIKASVSDQIAVLDADKLQFPITWRRWKAGDHFHPLGMSHRKKISDFLIDKKVPVNHKDMVTVLESNGEIVWVVGYRIDDRFKLTERTQRAISFSLQL